MYYNLNGLIIYIIEENIYSTQNESTQIIDQDHMYDVL